MSEGNVLPARWGTARGADLFDFVRGVSYDKKAARSVPGVDYVPILRAGNLQNGELDLSDLVYVPRAYVTDEQLLKQGDFVIAMSSGSATVVGKVSVVPDDQFLSFGAFCGLLRPRSPEIGRWLRLYFLSRKYRELISTRAAGININNLRAEHLLELEIPLPPLTEICRIENHYSTLSERLFRVREALHLCSPKIDQFRRSVLAAAFRGDLTADWRAENPDVKPASIALAPVLESGLTPRERRRRADPEPYDPSFTYEVPSTWRWASVDQLSEIVEYGTSAKTGEETSGVPIIRMGNIVDGRLTLHDLRYLPSNYDEFPRLLLQPGDILFNRTNSAELVGKSAVYAGAPVVASFASYLIRLRVGGCDPVLVSAYINSPAGRSWVSSIASQQVGQANISGGKLRTLGIPVPPPEEQLVLRQRVDAALATIHRVRHMIDDARTNLRDLESTILAKAFRGELVPQDPNDEPASVLLERIRAEREREGMGKPGRRGRKTKATG